MKENEYKCAGCGQVFAKGKSEEEARAEERELFGANDPDAQLLCDDCFNHWQKQFLGTATCDNAVHLELKKIVGRKIKVALLCGVSMASHKATNKPAQVTCPACKRAYVKRNNTLIQKHLRALAKKQEKENARS